MFGEATSEWGALVNGSYEPNHLWTAEENTDTFQGISTVKN